MATRKKKNEIMFEPEKKQGKFIAFIKEVADSFKGENEMSLNLKKVVVALLSGFFLVSLLIVAWIEGGRRHVLDYPDAVITAENKKCIDCHQSMTPGLVQQWKESKHSHSGIGCYNCHKAEEGDIDGMKHNGFFIATIVSPKDCSNCHSKQFDEFTSSHHASAGTILGSLDNELAEIVEGHMEYDESGNLIKGSPAATSGCLQCHGSQVKVLGEGKLDPETWPNTGIGRINPDGSKGSCSACHMRHNFSMAQARQPENCGRCHMGPDHPQLEIYKESKHGIAFEANRTRFLKDMDNKNWEPGVDFESGPTCSTCHMGKVGDMESTHDVGSRISWNLRPPVSQKIDSYAGSKIGDKVKSWELRREDMKIVCQSCHGPEWIENWYIQFDSFIGLYNDKFGRPATDLYNMIRQNNLITSDVTFDDKIEFTYFYLWHHEGRRARHGASMMGPDYTQWHGMFEVSKNFYQDFIPELKEVIKKGKSSGKEVAAAQVEQKMNQILNSPMHRWYIGKMPEKEKKSRKDARLKFQERYAPAVK